MHLSERKMSAAQIDLRLFTRVGVINSVPVPVSIFGSGSAVAWASQAATARRRRRRQENIIE